MRLVTVRKWDGVLTDAPVGSGLVDLNIENIAYARRVFDSEYVEIRFGSNDCVTITLDDYLKKVKPTGD